MTRSPSRRETAVLVPLAVPVSLAVLVPLAVPVSLAVPVPLALGLSLWDASRSLLLSLAVQESCLVYYDVITAALIDFFFVRARESSIP
ncbi:hypothetical protein EYF80_053967 [Liparis tanakae]|uniref:Uncharacterized protein n=1 Tax=Liparis tanakae TaxID=230148 RepID=A0A4Z2F549_9TELE|nr:hypothetical protein EYF80_053967 [Liparis tanakae]